MDSSTGVTYVSRTIANRLRAIKRVAKSMGEWVTVKRVGLYICRYIHILSVAIRTICHNIIASCYQYTITIQLGNSMLSLFDVSVRAARLPLDNDHCLERRLVVWGRVYKPDANLWKVRTCYDSFEWRSTNYHDPFRVDVCNGKTPWKCI